MLDKTLELYLQNANNKIDNLKTSNYSKSTTNSSNSSQARPSVKVQSVKMEADKFLKSIFDLMDNFFNPNFKPITELNENNEPQNSILQDFHNGS